MGGGWEFRIFPTTKVAPSCDWFKAKNEKEKEMQNFRNQNIGNIWNRWLCAIELYSIKQTEQPSSKPKKLEIEKLYFWFPEKLNFFLQWNLLIKQTSKIDFLD